MVIVQLNGVLPAVKLTRERMSHIQCPSMAAMREKSGYVAGCFVPY